ncbi:hypothetical protein [Alterisphingorhabdus coralli]|uniref:Uncharacterized protein n=1 Tax=Alterisphingorhabdus coralli TaxID=3071408 RepID=A0AA97F7Q9_9SPHN|nr:hypothetical protein [Parasphingorhabdus sp. SCSIO 66989]WOE74812.1 hypothetical protein RB602_13340 [Parasphingorhabdus sp. SCSIO 66989]
MRIKNPLKLAFVSLFAISLAIILGAQALSSVSAKKNPELALSAFPLNGHALEELAFDRFTQAATDPNNLTTAAQDAAHLAHEAIRIEPLAPKAHAILALAETDPEKRRQLIDTASKLNRRNLALQSLMLEQRLQDNNYDGVIETLDQILRVHPRRRNDFFPVLTQALSQEQTVTSFTDLLKNDLPWREAFLRYAVGKNEALSSLAAIRGKIDLDDELFDQRLISNLVKNGSFADARRLYLDITKQNSHNAKDGAQLDWRSTYAPFDWAFADERGFRAQPSVDGKELEIRIQAGQGGVIASRIIEAPTGPFSIQINHKLEPKGQSEDVKLQLTCAGMTTPFFEEPLGSSKNILAVTSRPEDCAFIAMAVNGRAWSGRPAIRGSLEKISIRPIEQ